MLESFIAAVVISVVGAVVTYGLHRIGRSQDDAARLQRETFVQFRRDIDAIAGALRMHRMPDGNLYRNQRRGDKRRAD